MSLSTMDTALHMVYTSEDYVSCSPKQSSLSLTIVTQTLHYQRCDHNTDSTYNQREQAHAGTTACADLPTPIANANWLHYMIISLRLRHLATICYITLGVKGNTIRLIVILQVLQSCNRALIPAWVLWSLVSRLPWGDSSALGQNIPWERVTNI